MPKYERSPELPPEGTPVTPDDTWEKFEHANRRAIEQRTEERIVITQLENWINTYAMKHDMPLPKNFTLRQFLELVEENMGVRLGQEVDFAGLEIERKNFDLLNNAIPEGERLIDFKALFNEEVPTAEKPRIEVTFSSDMKLSDVKNALKERGEEIVRFLKGEQ